MLMLATSLIGLLGLGGADAAPQHAIHFDGTGGYIEVPDSPDFSVATSGALTLSAWVRPDTLRFESTEGSGYVYWLGKGATGQQEWALRMYSDPNRENRANRISFYVFNPQGGLGIGSYFQDPIQPGEWIHIVGVADGERTAIYKNGSLRRCDQYTGLGDGTCHAYPSELWITPEHGTAPLRMGTRDLHSFFWGALAEVRVWNRALTPDEIAALSASAVVPRDGLVGEYLLDEAAGGIAHDTAGGHDGRLMRMLSTCSGPAGLEVPRGASPLEDGGVSDTLRPE